MKDILTDIVSHTHNLGFLNIVKITGDEKSTRIDSMADDRSVVMIGQTHNPYEEMIGVFGMPQLNKLKYLVDCAEYRDGAKITVIHAERNEEVIPIGIHFENKTGDFKNDYRFMNSEIINERLKTVKFKGAKWDVTVVPTLHSIQKFMFQAAANTELTSFQTKTEKNNLKFIFGDQGTHGGEFVFAQGIQGSLAKAHSWPVNAVLSILKIADVNNCKILISDSGALLIEMDSGLATYQYIIPAIN